MYPLNEPTIIIKFTTETNEILPDIYIRSLEDAIKANADNFDRLEEIRVRLINCRAEVDNLQGRLWRKQHGYDK